MFIAAQIGADELMRVPGSHDKVSACKTKRKLLELNVGPMRKVVRYLIVIW